MRKWPKEWVKAIYNTDRMAEAYRWGNQILDALDAVGALKEPPIFKIREIFWCNEHGIALERIMACKCATTFREVVDE